MSATYPYLVTVRHHDGSGMHEDDDDDDDDDGGGWRLKTLDLWYWGRVGEEEVEGLCAVLSSGWLIGLERLSVRTDPQGMMLQRVMQCLIHGACPNLLQVSSCYLLLL